MRFFFFFADRQISVSIAFCTIMVTVIRMGFFHLSAVSHIRAADSASGETPQQLLGLSKLVNYFEKKNIYIVGTCVVRGRRTPDADSHFPARHKKNSSKKVQVAVRLFSTDSIRSVQSRGFTSRFATCSDDLAQKRKLAFYSFSATPENTKTGSAQNKRTS